jgi:ATP-dependent helicase HrpA
MEIRKAGQTLIGFPALIDHGDAVTIEVFDEPEWPPPAPRRPAPAVCAADPRRAQVPGKEHPRPAEDGRGLHAAGHAGRTARQIIDVALDRAFLLDPLPTDEADFKRRVEEGRGRLTLIANEVARLAGTILTEYAAQAQDQGHQGAARTPPADVPSNCSA